MVLEVEEGYPRVVPGDFMPIHQVRHPAELDDPVNLAVEEQRLAARFGAAYAEYLRRVPRWVPRLKR